MFINHIDAQVDLQKIINGTRKGSFLRKTAEAAQINSVALDLLELHPKEQLELLSTVATLHQNGKPDEAISLAEKIKEVLTKDFNNQTQNLVNFVKGLKK